MFIDKSPMFILKSNTANPRLVDDRVYSDRFVLGLRVLKMNFEDEIS